MTCECKSNCFVFHLYIINVSNLATLHLNADFLPQASQVSSNSAVEMENKTSDISITVFKRMSCISIKLFYSLSFSWFGDRICPDSKSGTLSSGMSMANLSGKSNATSPSS